MNNISKIVVAVAAGAAAGVVLGILIAPDKGTETRKKINEGSKKLADNFRYRYRKGKEELNDLKEDIEKTISEKVGEFV